MAKYPDGPIEQSFKKYESGLLSQAEFENEIRTFKRQGDNLTVRKKRQMIISNLGPE